MSTPHWNPRGSSCPCHYETLRAKGCRSYDSSRGAGNQTICVVFTLGGSCLSLQKNKSVSQHKYLRLNLSHDPQWIINRHSSLSPFLGPSVHALHSAQFCASSSPFHLPWTTLVPLGLTATPPESFLHLLPAVRSPEQVFLFFQPFPSLYYLQISLFAFSWFFSPPPWEQRPWLVGHHEAGIYGQSMNEWQ